MNPLVGNLNWWRSIKEESNVPVRQTNVSFNMDLTICYEEASCSSELIQNIVGSDSCNLGSLVVLVLAIMLVVIKYDPCGCW